MLKEVEREYKFLVSEEQFLNVKNHFSKQIATNKIHTNYYYDTKDNYFNSIKHTIRIRQIEDKLKLQLKNHKKYIDGYCFSEEKTIEINDIPITLNNEFLNVDVCLKGSLITVRDKFSFGKNSIVCFDENYYLGKCDFEVEIEFSQDDFVLVNEFIDKFGLQIKESMSKSERFFERWEDIYYE